MASVAYATGCVAGRVAELGSMPVGLSRCLTCFLLSFALFCFFLRIPRSLSALISALGWFDQLHGSPSASADKRTPTRPPCPPLLYHLPTGKGQAPGRTEEPLRKGSAA
jgi:hypothetical protein